jgi:oxygen-independent coproporphyrinogen-3 oxidase
MSSLYLHIPYCKQACHYCDFHFSTNQKTKDSLLEAMRKEIALQKDFLGRAVLKTIYFGGGTPSLLSTKDLNGLLDTVKNHFTVDGKAEITLEANPDDFSKEKVKMWKDSGINRLSIGIQTFHDPSLRFMNRAHNALEAENCARLAQEIGISNLSIDLIYGLPDPESAFFWKEDLRKALNLGVQHISAYSLTIEPQTAFGRWTASGKLEEQEDTAAAEQFEELMDALPAAGYEHYEISNFALPGYRSRHNTNYWKKGSYLGVGPGAHSYNGSARFANLSNNPKYIKALLEGNHIPQTIEPLARLDHINEYLLTSLRTLEGCDTAFLRQSYGFDINAVCQKELAGLFQRGWVHRDGSFLRLTRSGKLMADSVAEALFQVEEDSE